MTDQTSTIPKGWKMTTLEEVAEKIGDGLHGTPEYSNSGEYYFVNGNNIGNGRIVIKPDTRKVDAGEFEKYKKDLGGNTILLSINGTIGNLAKYKDEKCILGKSAAYINIRNENAQDFIYYLMLDSRFQRDISKNANGSTIKNVSLAQLRNYSFIIPSNSEQRAIAAVLSALDDKIELLREQNKTLEATAQTIFKEWFVKFNFPGATGKIIDSELGGIPEGWRIGALIEEGVSEFIKTNINNFEGAKDYVETSNVNLSDVVGNFEKITYEKRASRANMQPIAYSIWFARMAESRKYLLFQERDKQNIETKILSTGFAGIKCIKDYLYFYWCFILSDTFNDLKNQFAEGAVQVAISNGGINRILLTLPPKEVAKKFTETVSPCFEKTSNNNSQIQVLSALRDALLPKLMKGEVRVKGFEN